MLDSLILAFSLISPLYGPPTFTFVRNLGPLPNEDEGWALVRAGYAMDVMGHELSLDYLRHVDEDWSIHTLYRRFVGRPHIVSLYVNLNQLPPEAIVETMRQLHSGWNPKKKVIVVFRLSGDPQVPLPEDHPDRFIRPTSPVSPQNGPKSTGVIP
jgi:hypothetical protein